MEGAGEVESAFADEFGECGHLDVERDRRMREESSVIHELHQFFGDRGWR